MMPSAESSVGDALGFVAQLTRAALVLPETASDQLRWCDLAPVGEGDRRDDDQDTVLRESPAVTQRDVLDVTDAEAVDEGDPGLDAVDDARAATR